MGETDQVIEGRLRLTIDMTSTQAAALLEKLENRDELRRLLGPNLEALHEYGIYVEEDRLALEGTDEAPHEPPHEPPSKELVEEVTRAIRAVIKRPTRNPPMFAICSRIGIVAYTAAAAPPPSD
jgi:hypothetical protein